MIAPKSKLPFLLAALVVLIMTVMVSCNDNSDASRVPPNDSVDTSKMDTATTRPPVKTPN